MLDKPYRSAQWFSTQSLHQSIDRATWDRGLSLYLKQKVLYLDIEPSGDQWHLEADVQGSQREPYEVNIEMAMRADGQVENWESDCTCPVAYKCKHAVAVMLKAAQQGLRLMPANVAANWSPTAPTAEQVEADRQAAIAREAERARQEAEAPLLRWLQQLDRASGALPDPDKEPNLEYPGLPRRQQPHAEFYLYLLSVHRSGRSGPRLQLNVQTSYKKINGDWAKTRLIKSRPDVGSPVFDTASELDHQVLQLVRAMPAGEVAHYYYSYYFNDTVMLDGRAGLLLLEQAASTGRLLLAGERGSVGKVIRLGSPQELQWQWVESVQPTTGVPSWSLQARLASASACICLNQPPLYFDPEQGCCGLVTAAGLESAQLDVLLQAPAINPEVLKTHQLALLQRLGNVPAPPLLEPVPKLEGLAPSACLWVKRVAAVNAPSQSLLQLQLTFDYAGHRGWWVGQGSTVLVDSEAGRVLLDRDVVAELEAVAELTGLGLCSDERGTFSLPGRASQQLWFEWAEQDFAVFRQAGFIVTLDPSLHQWIRHADVLDVKLAAPDADADADADGTAELSSPWFDLSLGMEINGVRQNILPWLPALIAEAAASPLDAVTGLPIIAPFIFLPDNDAQGFVRLPTESLKPWLAALLELVGDRSHNFNAEHLRLSRFDALRASAALGEGAVWEGMQALRKMVRQLSGQAQLPAVAMPASVNAELRPYQQLGLNWLQFLRHYALGGILADDMGLGKTLQTLVHIQVEKDAGRLKRPALIVAPVSLLGNWQREAARFCPDLRCLVLHGKERHELAESLHDHDIVITPYSLLERDRERWLKVKWHLVVLDEAQNIKNASTQAAQVASLLDAGQRLCLSGTPMENHLGEIWSLFHFLMPGFLGSQKKFQELFRGPIEKQANSERLQQLRARITPFMLRRTKALVASELPPKIETVMRVELLGKQADLYETIRLGMEKSVREALDNKGLAKSQITILDALLKLRQVCCDPHLVALTAAKKVNTSAKLERLMEMLPEMLSEGRRILLFSQFTSMLALIEVELEKLSIPWVKLTGQSQKRDALIERFTSGAVPLFLISLKAGGTGLNLPQADTVIHYDPWWNPAVENQATDRAHRIGQTQSVWVVKLVAQGTIEERILALQERKAALAQSMYSGSVARKQPLFSENDLNELLKPLSA